MVAKKLGLVCLAIASCSGLIAQNVNKTSGTNRVRPDCVDCPPTMNRVQSSIFGLSLDFVIGNTFMNYGSQEAYNPPDDLIQGGRDVFHASNRQNFFGRVSLEPISVFVWDDISLRIGGEVGYRFGTNFKVRQANVFHRGQFQFGALFRLERNESSLGVGIDYRNDALSSEEYFGSRSEHDQFRMWTRIQYRYTFKNWDRNKWFAGAEFAQANRNFIVDPYKYYRDYVINTGHTPLGSVRTVVDSGGSLAKGHFPRWELGVFGGFRFGRHPMWKREDHRPRPVFVNSARNAELVQMAREGAELSRILLLEGVKEEAYPRVRFSELPLSKVEGNDITDDPVGVMKEQGFESFLVHFKPNVDRLDLKGKDLIDQWVERVWKGRGYGNVFESGQLLIVGHCDERTEGYNNTLSLTRAQAVRDYLMEKWGIFIQEVSGGDGSFNPISKRINDKRYAWLVLHPTDERNFRYDKVVIVVREPVADSFEPKALRWR
jgi:outer membrane protein OmpA-like peptidoglycan-associated protein